MIILLFILTLILAKVIWVIYETSRQGSLVKEQTERLFVELTTSSQRSLLLQNN